MVVWSSLQEWWKDYYCAKLCKALEGPAAASVLSSGHVLLTCGVAAALLISQLSLQQWPSNFFGFCMLSPILAALLVGAGAVAAFPGVAGSLPVLLGVATAGLIAWQTTLGGLFHQLPVGDSRALYTMVNTLLVTAGVFLASRGVVPPMLRKALIRSMGADRAAPPPPPSVTEEALEEDDADSTVATLK